MGRPSEGPPAAAAPRSHRQQQRKGNKQPHAPPTRARRGWRVPWRGAVVALLAGGAAVGVSLVAWSILYVSGAALAAAVAGESHPGTPLEGWRYARAKLLEGLPLLPAAWTRLRRRRIAPALQAAADAGVAIFLVQVRAHGPP